MENTLPTFANFALRRTQFHCNPIELRWVSLWAFCYWLIGAFAAPLVHASVVNTFDCIHAGMPKRAASISTFYSESLD